MSLLDAIRSRRRRRRPSREQRARQIALGQQQQQQYYDPTDPTGVRRREQTLLAARASAVMARPQPTPTVPAFRPYVSPPYPATPVATPVPRIPMPAPAPAPEPIPAPTPEPAAPGNSGEHRQDGLAKAQTGAHPRTLAQRMRGRADDFLRAQDARYARRPR